MKEFEENIFGKVKGHTTDKELMAGVKVLKDDLFYGFLALSDRDRQDVCHMINNILVDTTNPKRISYK